MNKMQEQVAKFHKAFVVPVNSTPSIPSDFNRLILRCKLILEEAIEFCDACGVDVRILDNHDASQCSNLCMSTLQFKRYAISQPNLTAIADASTDLKYVTFGADLEFGIDAQKVFDEVHRSNLSKMWTERERLEYLKYEDSYSFEPIFLVSILEGPSWNERCYSCKRSDGKIIKSPSYSPADIKTALGI